MQRHQRFAWTWAAAGRVAGGLRACGTEDTSDELKHLALTTAPKQYTIAVSRVRDWKVVAGFGWVEGIQWS